MTPGMIRRPISLLLWIDGIVSVMLGLGLGCWVWLLQNRAQLPSPDLKAGKTLLKQYQATSHDLFLAIFALCVIALVMLIRRAQHQQRQLQALTPEPSKLHPLLRFAREHPIVLALFVGYTVAMVQGTTWMYPELVGWFKGIPDDHLLNNFSFRQDFLKETMRRDDYRFFPLAHQDLHVLSWFTGYVKVWMLVSAAELFTVVVVCTRIVRALSGRDRVPALLLITSLLLLFHPATGMAFFQFPYCERFLTFVFALYCGAYLHHLQHRDQASFYSSILFGLIGIFLKDIAVVLFVAPPALILIAGSLGLVEGKPCWSKSTRKNWSEAYRLELWLCSLMLVFLMAYVLLSALPSAFVNKGSYNKNKEFLFAPDWRFWFLIGFSLIRAAAISLRRSMVNLLDGLNIAALIYSAGLLALIGFESHTYLTLPVQMVTVLDLSFAWCCWVSPALSQRISPRSVGVIGVATVLITVAVDHYQNTSFAHSVYTIKIRQQSWLNAYEAIDATTAPIKAKGEAINLIFSKDSWFSAKRHLSRLRFDRLIEFDPKRNLFSVEEGIGKGEAYKPQQGDFLFSIDKGEETLPQDLVKGPNLLLYEDKNNQINGRIYRITQ